MQTNDLSTPTTTSSVAIVDRTQLEGLYRTYAPLVHARAKRIVGSDADDIVHEVFLQMLKKPPEDRGILSWMYRTSTNICIDRLRSRQRRQSEWKDELISILDTGSVDVSKTVEDQELCRRLLHRFDRKTQALVMLVYFDEMTTTQAAETLGVSRKCATIRLQRFHDNARKILTRWSSDRTRADSVAPALTLDLA